MKYLKLFDTESTYLAYRNGSDYLKPNVSLSDDKGEVYYNYPSPQLLIAMQTLVYLVGQSGQRRMQGLISLQIMVFTSNGVTLLDTRIAKLEKISNSIGVIISLALMEVIPTLASTQPLVQLWNWRMMPLTSIWEEIGICLHLHRLVN